MKRQYFDKNGKEIKAGMIIMDSEGNKEAVYDLGEDLGLNASNERYLETHPDVTREYYPLYQFSLREDWEIVGGEDNEKI